MPIGAGPQCLRCSWKCNLYHARLDQGYQVPERITPALAPIDGCAGVHTLGPLHAILVSGRAPLEQIPGVSPIPAIAPTPISTHREEFHEQVAHQFIRLRLWLCA